jgi:hypothetical protein
MALNPSFTTAQLPILTSLLFTDTSTGSDGAIVARRIYLQKVDGTYQVPPGTTTTYIPWPLSSGATLTVLNVMDIDYAFNTTVDWVDSGGNVLYTVTQEQCFPNYANYNAYQLTTLLAANPSIINKANFWKYYAQLWACIISAERAISVASDIAGSQIMLNNAAQLYNNKPLFFT